MKVFEAEEGKYLAKDGEVIGTKLYTPDDFDGTKLVQVTAEEAKAMEEVRQKEMEAEMEKEREEEEARRNTEAG